ncbi:hypothetical protein ACKF11_13910 [Methylobacillus sp. Pita2]|uniref:hypothetical protein n=1 Tax=Methylobacillus sp. Pita2 TaxID=3383245 RepID=UPI0038B460EA
MITEVQFLGQRDACAFRATKPTFAISITNSGAKQANLRRIEFQGILRLEFDDVNESMAGLEVTDVPDLLVGHESGRRIMINGNEYCDYNDAKKILAFTEMVADSQDAYAIMVHCEVGASRSAAVAKFINRFYGADLIIGQHDGSQANTRLARLLDKVSAQEQPALGELPPGILNLRKLGRP